MSPGALPWGGAGGCGWGAWFSSWYVVSIDTGHRAQSPQSGPRWSPAFKMEPVLSVSSFTSTPVSTGPHFQYICVATDAFRSSSHCSHRGQVPAPSPERGQGVLSSLVVRLPASGPAASFLSSPVDCQGVGCFQCLLAFWALFRGNR